MFELHTREVIVVDADKHWCSFWSSELQRAGFKVCSTNEYMSDFSTFCSSLTKPLIVFGCSHIGPEEEQFVQSLQKQDCPVIVFCKSPSFDEVRLLFRLGAHDVLEKSTSRLAFLDVIDRATQIAAKHRKPAYIY